MMTTPNMLTSAGQTALKALGDGKISAHEAVWEGISLTRVSKTAHAVLRAAIQVQNYRLNRATISKIVPRRKGSLKLVRRKSA